ncbi:MAG: SDR family NAD(P)-dependent oxidoreductase [Bacteroidales bacterium]
MDPQKKVLITGAAGGLGSSAVSFLVRKGWKVFATDIRETEISHFQGDRTFSFIPLDVTSEESVAKAFQLISAQTDWLDAIIHMAGILQVGPLVEIPEEFLRQSLEINLMGVSRVNNRFFPLLRQPRGRIVILSSETGRQTAAPFNGPYAISKHALEAYSDALRRELSLLGIRVIKIQPGPVKTEMTGSGEYQFKEAAAASIHFKKALLKGTSYLPGVYRNARDPDIVAAVILKALESPRPRRAYKVKQDRIRDLLDRLPEGWTDHLIKRVLSKG